MVAKRSGTRPLHGCGQATQPPHRAEVFDLNDALSYGRLRFAQYVDSPEEMARGGGSVRDRYSAESAFVPRTPDNERRSSPRRCERRRACAAAPRRPRAPCVGARPAGLGEQARHLKRQTRRIGRGDKEPAARNASSWFFPRAAGGARGYRADAPARPSKSAKRHPGSGAGHRQWPGTPSSENYGGSRRKQCLLPISTRPGRNLCPLVM